jgi:hypothetical protein
VIVSDSEKLTQREIVGVYLIGKYFAKQLEISEDDSATNKEIAEGLRLNERVVGARLSRKFLEENTKSL